MFLEPAGSGLSTLIASVAKRPSVFVELGDGDSTGLSNSYLLIKEVGWDCSVGLLEVGTRV